MADGGGPTLTIDGGGVGSEFDGTGGPPAMGRVAVICSGVAAIFGIDGETAVFEFATEVATSGLDGGGRGSGIAETFGVSIGSRVEGLGQVAPGSTEYKNESQNSIPF
jgi:hypothetical protein